MANELKIDEMKIKEDVKGKGTTTDTAKKTVDLTGDGGVVKTVIRKSSLKQKPRGGCDVTIHYTGKLSDGTVFFSTREKNESFTYKLGTCMHPVDCSKLYLS